MYSYVQQVSIFFPNGSGSLAHVILHNMTYCSYRFICYTYIKGLYIYNLSLSVRFSVTVATNSRKLTYCKATIKQNKALCIIKIPLVQADHYARKNI
jgi:hypothetical protein